MSVYYIDNDIDPKAENELNIEANDPSLNGKKENSMECKNKLNLNDFNKLFFSNYNIEYISEYFFSTRNDLRVVTHPYKTNTCFEKAKVLGSCDPLNIIKVFYFECPQNDSLYAVVIPETGCFIDKAKLQVVLDIPESSYIKKANELPNNMSYGTCSPFILDEDIKGSGGRVERIIFDTETLVSKKNDSVLDDFSFGQDHRMSVQMGYYHCFKMLKKRYPGVIADEEILNLSFKEKFIRDKGKIRIAYEFKTLNYRTAQFINSIHGYGDVSIVNDYIDELDLPEILTTPKQ